jgi:hypothetical protein
MACLAVVNEAAAAQKILSTSGAWQAVEASGDGKTLCYLVASPTTRLPPDLKRDPGHLFVTLTTGAKRTEASIEFGYRLGPGEHRASTGDRAFALVAQNENAWLRDDAQEDAFVAALKGGRELTVTARSARGNDTTDLYSLIGFGAAHAALLDRCRP